MSFKTAFFAFFKGEKSQAELEAYRGAARQIDDLEAAIETQVLQTPVAAGAPPWEHPTHHQQAMAFTWIARALSTIAGTLLEIDAKEDPGTAGYLPVVTYGQVKALYTQVPDFVHATWEALANPRYRASKPLPLPLGPRIEADGRCPYVHLKGMQAAAVALDAYGQARLNAYLAAIEASGATPPDAVKGVLAELGQIRARAQSKLSFATDQLAALAKRRDIPDATHEETETRLWEALSDHFLLGQFLAMPGLLASAAMAGQHATGRTIAKQDRWLVAEADARRELENTKFGEQEMKEFWSRKAWRTTPREERYFAQTKRLLDEGAISVITRWSTCPFAPVYQTLQPCTVLDEPLGKGVEFFLNMDDNEDDLQVGTPRFRRTASYEEEHEEGHSDEKAG